MTSPLAGKGAAVLRGTLDDLDLLDEATGNADAVIHLAFNHDFSKYAENSEQDRRAIEAMGEALVGTDKPILVTTGLAMLAPGRVATEADVPPLSDPNYLRRTEAAAAALAERGVRVGKVRLATTVHGSAPPRSWRCWRGSRARRASRPISATVPTAGLRFTYRTRGGSTAWHWKQA